MSSGVAARILCARRIFDGANGYAVTRRIRAALGPARQARRRRESMASAAHRLRLRAEADLPGELDLDQFVERAFDLSADASHRDVVFTAVRCRDRFADHESQTRAVRARDARDRDAKVKEASARVRIADDREDVVASDTRERDEGDAIRERRPDEAVAVSPQESIAELARFDRLAEAA